jgi:ADP-heptose:LPS heptosyltransferase
LSKFSDPGLIDWGRLAEPQADQYDSEVILWLASSTTSAGRPVRYVRTPVGESPAVFDGQVAVRYVYRSLPEFRSLAEKYPDAPADHRNIREAAEHVRKWPEAFAQCQRLLEAIHPASNPEMPLESAEIYRGSLCHSYEQLFGTMWATIFCPVGLAEAIVHEMAHQKLRVLGVSFESATAVVGNNPGDQYVSPVIKDRKRPMTAVLHAEYSYVHVTTLDIHMLRAEREPDRRKVLGEVLERNLARIEEGYDTIRTHFKAGERGLEFIEGFFHWIEKTIRTAKELLGRSPVRGNQAQVRTGPTRIDRDLGKHTPVSSRIPQSPVVFSYNGGIGDHLCNLPALRALESVFPGQLALVCGKGDRDLYYADLRLRDVHEIDLELIDGGWRFEANQLAHRISDCDLLLCINPWHTHSVSELIAKFPDVPSIGFFHEFRRHLTCDYEGHAMDMAFAVPMSLNSALKLSDFSQPPAISSRASAMAQEFRRLHAGSCRTLFVHTDTKPEKRWPRERFERVLNRFLYEFRNFKALVVDLHGEAIGGGMFPNRVVPLNLPLDATFAVLRKCDLFLGIDSCHIHAADLFRVPGVGLFGPTTSRRWGYKFTRHRHIQTRGSMDAIAVADVYDALRSLVRENSETVF